MGRADAEEIARQLTHKGLCSEVAASGNVLTTNRRKFFLNVGTGGDQAGVSDIPPSIKWASQGLKKINRGKNKKYSTFSIENIHICYICVN